MTVPEAFRNRDDAEIMVRFEATDVGRLEAVRKLTDLPVVKPTLDDMDSLAVAYWKEGRRDDVVAVLEEAIRLFPDDPYAWAGFARYLIREEPRRDPPRAVALARKAMALSEGKNGDVVDTLIEALKLDGKAEEAAPYIEERARMPRAKEMIHTLMSAMDCFENDVGRYPTAAEGLKVLIEPPASPADAKKWKGPYIKELQNDPWGNPYKYVYPGAAGPKTFDVFSVGPDGKEGTEDDIVE